MPFKIVADASPLPDNLAQLPNDQPKCPRSESPRGYGRTLDIIRGDKKTDEWLAKVIKFETTIEQAYQELYPTSPSLLIIVQDFLLKVAQAPKKGSYLLRNQLYLKTDESPAALKTALHLLDTHLRSTEAHPIVQNLIRYCRHDSYPATQIDQSLEIHEGENYYSLPANGHADNNQDTVETGTLTNGGKFTIVCDGVSDCGNGITGKEASRAVATILKEAWSSYQFPDRFNPNNPNFLDALRIYQAELLNERKHRISPPQSETTAEVALQIPFGDDIYLVTLSLGDTGTIVIKPGSPCIMMNKTENFTHSLNGNIFIEGISPELTSYKLNRDLSKPGNTIK
jgi:hypothetical protein